MELPDPTLPSDGALDGVQVLDVSANLSGAVISMLLADFGANVVHVRHRLPAPDVEAADPMWRRHQAVLEAAVDDPRVCELVRRADVVITSDEHEPGTVRNAWAVRIHVPNLIPGEAALDGFAGDALAATSWGIACRQSSSDGGPIEAVYPHLSYLRGAWAAALVVLGLRQRRSTGAAPQLEVSAEHAVLLAATTTFAVGGGTRPPDTAVGPGGPNPAFSLYRCADGRWLFLGGLSEKFQRRAFQELGVQILDDPRIDGRPERLYDPANRGWVRSALAAAFATRPREEWVERFIAADCPVGRVGQRDNWLDHEQIVALGLRCAIEDPVVGNVIMPGPPLDMTGTPARRPAPRRSFTNVDWEERPDGPARPGSPPRDEPLPLNDVRVLDLGTVVAGPYTGMLLASLGADVLKIEPPSGDPHRVRGFPHNRGMRSLAVDLSQPAGQRVLDSLLDRSDVVVDNFRLGVLERLGLSYEDLARRAPHLISASITGFGRIGPLRSLPGYDPILQAMSGMMAAQGGDDDPHFSIMAIHDIGAACLTVLGITLALYRHDGVRGQGVHVSLAAASTFMQSAELAQYQGRCRMATGGRDYRGRDGSRYFMTADGYVRVHARLEQVRSALSTLEDEPASASPDVVVALRQFASDDAVALLRRHGVIAVAARSFWQLARDDDPAVASFLERLLWPDGRSVTVPARYCRWPSANPRAALLPPPGLGEHTATILREAGWAEDAVDRLVEGGIVIAGGPLQSVPDVGYR